MVNVLTLGLCVISEYVEGPKCRYPDPVPHAVPISFIGGLFEHGTVIRYTCEDGYEGGGITRCEQSGEWSRLPTCSPRGL